MEDAQFTATEAALMASQAAVSNARIARTAAWLEFVTSADAAYDELDPDVRLTYDSDYYLDPRPDDRASEEIITDRMLNPEDY